MLLNGAWVMVVVGVEVEVGGSVGWSPDGPLAQVRETQPGTR